VKRKRIRDQCPECGRAGGRSRRPLLPTSTQLSPQKKPTYQRPDKHAAARAYFAHNGSRIERIQDDMEKAFLRLTPGQAQERSRPDSCSAWPSGLARKSSTR
jgi:hypothetical protein